MKDYLFALEIFVNERQLHLFYLFQGKRYSWEQYKRDEKRYGPKPFSDNNFCANSFISDWVSYVESEFNNILIYSTSKKYMNRSVLANCMVELDQLSRGQCLLKFLR
ncbi:hypothetical protein SAMN05444392_11626 [Seinonella peptonophila]|uniref:Uncharacterized protein n=1 Tax=Seinonella peptonophila TaxID=112248 RepID=A0A1M5AVD9_9BACL|nr:hypothetical protein SAMN05444392_11626 [Seinonella peptonophila]